MIRHNISKKKEKTGTSGTDKQLYKMKKIENLKKENEKYEMENPMVRLERRIEIKEETLSELEDKAKEAK